MLTFVFLPFVLQSTPPRSVPRVCTTTHSNLPWSPRVSAAGAAVARTSVLHLSRSSPQAPSKLPRLVDLLFASGVVSVMHVCKCARLFQLCLHIWPQVCLAIRASPGTVVLVAAVTSAHTCFGVVAACERCRLVDAVFAHATAVLFWFLRRLLSLHNKPGAAVGTGLMDAVFAHATAVLSWYLLRLLSLQNRPGA